MTNQTKPGAMVLVPRELLVQVVNSLNNSSNSVDWDKSEIIKSCLEDERNKFSDNESLRLQCGGMQMEIDELKSKSSEQPPAVDVHSPVQVVGRVWHLLDGSVSAVLNSAGRILPDDEPLVSLKDHSARVAPLLAEIEALRYDCDVANSVVNAQKARIAELEAGQGEAVAWVNGEQLTLCQNSPLDISHPNPIYHDLPRNIAGSAMKTDYCDTPLYRQAQPAKAKVVLPERKDITDHFSHDGGKRKGWNACLDATSKLNGGAE